jgi:hypothetical protein
MLRSDQCFPSRPQDVDNLTYDISTGDNYGKTRDVELVTYSSVQNPTIIRAARWRSYDWEVVDVQFFPIDHSFHRSFILTLKLIKSSVVNAFARLKKGARRG